jgi:hypothetical protein
VTTGRQRARWLARTGHDHPATHQDHGKLRRRQDVHRLAQALAAAGPTLDLLCPSDLGVELTEEVIARDVDLHRPALRHRDGEGAMRKLGDPIRSTDVRLELRDVREDRELVGLLEATQSHGGTAGLRSDCDDGRVRPIGGRDRGDEVRDARSVLGHADAVPSAGPGVAVGHVGGVLLVSHRDETNPGGRKQIERIHVGRTHDPECVGHALGDELLDEGLGGCHSRHGGDSDLWR